MIFPQEMRGIQITT